MLLQGKRLSLLFCLLALFFGFHTSTNAAERLNGTYLATAYSQTGLTKSGEYTHRHVVAADPDVLPIGSRIRIRNAGKYSGEYVVADTGGKIIGRRLDIYMPNTLECKKFGARNVRVKVIEVGTGTHVSAKESDQKVTAEVKSDLKKGAVGGAATQVDWAQKGAVVNSVAAQAVEGPPPDTTRPILAKQVNEAENRPPVKSTHPGR